MERQPSMTETDKGLLERLRGGDKEVFEKLFWRYSPRVYHFALALLYDRALAEDLAQTTFLKLWERRGAIDPAMGVEPYLYTIARHLIYKETRSRLRTEELRERVRPGADAEDPREEERIDATILSKRLQGLIDELPPARREIFRLSRMERLSHKEIATRLSLSEKTVETQIGRALRFLRERLAREGWIPLFLLWMVK